MRSSRGVNQLIHQCCNRYTSHGHPSHGDLDICLPVNHKGRPLYPRCYWLKWPWNDLFIFYIQWRQDRSCIKHIIFWLLIWDVATSTLICVFLLVWYLKKTCGNETKHNFQIPHTSQFYMQNITHYSPRTFGFMIMQSFLLLQVK